MIQLTRAFAGFAALAALTACVEMEGGGGTTTVMPPMAGGPPFIEGSFSASEAAVNACRDLLASRTSGGVTVVGSEFSQANSAVYMRVGANGAPWRCIVSDDGSNPSIMFMGDEGAM
ncbi:hypothetical protein [Salipiger mucosus]|uniref:Lipoprotein n=1 Tax=Salipiger mucosus DSM 16094 TaxID=1123237 RepID=S9Q9C5_9RHOB|nr:hypothetical protein [Salipiger mucosus]EPX76572.1 hypothetical protein Salmuc_00404 [Salipiger mucosus DSM 16094]